MDNLFLSPPIAFIIILLSVSGLCYLSAFLSAPGKEESARKTESYACGQRGVKHVINPDYSQFFPFAFFFTIMHILVMIIATAPAGAISLPLLYVAVGVLAMLIIFRG